MKYKRRHVVDTVINDEQRGSQGLAVTIHVDTHGMVNIELGSSMTIRTDEHGIQELRRILENAEIALDDITSGSDAPSGEELRTLQNTLGWPS